MARQEDCVQRKARARGRAGSPSPIPVTPKPSASPARAPRAGMFGELWEGSLCQVMWDEEAASRVSGQRTQDSSGPYATARVCRNGGCPGWELKAGCGCWRAWGHLQASLCTEAGSALLWPARLLIYCMFMLNYYKL